MVFYYITCIIIAILALALRVPLLRPQYTYSNVLFFFFAYGYNAIYCYVKKLVLCNNLLLVNIPTPPTLLGVAF